MSPKKYFPYSNGLRLRISEVFAYCLQKFYLIKDLCRMEVAYAGLLSLGWDANRQICSCKFRIAKETKISPLPSWLVEVGTFRSRFNPRLLGPAFHHHFHIICFKMICPLGRNLTDPIAFTFQTSVRCDVFCSLGRTTTDDLTRPLCRALRIRYSSKARLLRFYGSPPSWNLLTNLWFDAFRQNEITIKGRDIIIKGRK